MQDHVRVGRQYVFGMEELGPQLCGIKHRK